jgi:16S rRNA C967 or C1407 C5-methylase (RsmB/RsmF family)
MMMERKDIKKINGIDATAAPGNKSLQLSEILGSVLSYEKDPRRFETLKSRSI